MKKTQFKRLRILFLIAVLIICLAALMDKRRHGLALVEQQHQNTASIWRLAAYLPPDESLSPLRSLVLDNVEGARVQVEMYFDLALMSPWPDKISFKVWPFPAHENSYILLEDERHRLLAAQEGDTANMVDEASYGVKNLKYSDSGNAISHMLKWLGLEQPEKITAVEQKKLFTGTIIKLVKYLESAPRMQKDPLWKELGEGLWEAAIKMDYGPRLGKPFLYVLKVDPDKYKIKPYHENQFPPLVQRDIAQWHHLLGTAEGLINGGQYYQDRSYIGILKCDGVFISVKAHSSWQGFLVSQPNNGKESGLPMAAIIDLAQKQPPSWEDYANVMQSLMLFDETGKIRVNESYLLAGRSVIAEDDSGYIWLVMSPAALSLHDLSLFLMRPEYKLKKALCLDGGFESQIIWQRPGADSFVAKAEYLAFPDGTLYNEIIYRSLPSVIAVEK